MLASSGRISTPRIALCTPTQAVPRTHKDSRHQRLRHGNPSRQQIVRHANKSRYQTLTLPLKDARLTPQTPKTNTTMPQQLQNTAHTCGTGGADAPSRAGSSERSRFVARPAVAVLKFYARVCADAVGCFGGTLCRQRRRGCRRRSASCCSMGSTRQATYPPLPPPLTLTPACSTHGSGVHCAYLVGQ